MSQTKKEFHNPYNFIPLGEPMDGLLGQHPPAGHDRYHGDRWSGRITIEIETVTPLLIPDAASVTTETNGPEKGHKTFDVRKDPKGRPLLPVTTVKGALRSAFEAVTNSRLGVFGKHDAPPARRMRGTEGAAMVPARIVQHDDGFAVELWKGSSAGWPELVKNKYYAIKNGNAVEPMFAAWLPRYQAKKGGIAPWACKLQSTGKLPMHGLEVYCWVERMRHKRKNFKYWRVREIATDLSALPTEPSPSPERNSHAPSNPSEFRKVRGFVFVSEQNTENKHDERVFFVDEDESPLRVNLSVEAQRTLKKRWNQLVENYQALHKKEIDERGGVSRAAKFIKAQPGKVAFSRHVFKPADLTLKAGTPFDPDEDATAETGTLCYAQLMMKNGKVWTDKYGCPTIEALYPVMISRELGYMPPEKLMPDKLHPAQKLGDLSPAERIFGWVRQNGKGSNGAYKGQLRIRSVECIDDNAIDIFSTPLPLANLGQPKFSQTRFYVGKVDKEGENGSLPLDEGVSSASTAYFAKTNPERWPLRGIKVYQHQAATDKIADYWDSQKAIDAPAIAANVEASTINNQPIYREYIRQPDAEGHKKDTQNRSIRGWVKPSTKFIAVIDVINLNIAELAVLIWLLNLPDQHYHRIGGGKPLGFGSVKISIKSVDLALGAARRERYRSLFDVSDYPGLADNAQPYLVKGDAESARAILDAGLDEIKRSGVKDFERLPHIAAFLQAARGYDDEFPTHYPRMNPTPNSAGKNYEWFVANENGGKYALPALVAPSGQKTTLPVDPT